MTRDVAPADRRHNQRGHVIDDRQGSDRTRRRQLSRLTLPLLRRRFDDAPSRDLLNDDGREQVLDDIFRWVEGRP